MFLVPLAWKYRHESAEARQVQMQRKYFLNLKEKAIKNVL